MTEEKLRPNFGIGGKALLLANYNCLGRVDALVGARRALKGSLCGSVFSLPDELEMANATNMSKKIQSIQALRSLASPIVAVSHLLNIAVALGGASLYSRQQFFIIPADLAVSCFFGVSGFIMGMIAHKSRSAADFVVRRAIRIFPSFWVALAVAMVIPAIIPGMNPVTNWQQVLLLQRAEPLPLTWALSFEIYFYGAVALIMTCCRGAIARGFAFFASMHVGMILLAMSGAVTPHPVLVPAAASFWVGVAVHLLSKGRIEWGPTLIIATAISILIANMDIGPRGNNMLLYTVIFSPIFLAMIKLEQNEVFMVPAFLIWWSSRSYALFLWHLPVMAGSAWLVRTYSDFETDEGLALFLIASLLGSILAALVGYRFIELPITSRLSKAWDIQSRWQAVAAA